MNTLKDISDDTYLKETRNAIHVDDYAIDTTSASGTISNVSVYARTKRVGTTFCYGGPYSLIWYEDMGGWMRSGVYQSLSTSWTTQVHSMDTNQFSKTGGTWTWGDIALLKIRIQLKGYNSSNYACCAGLWYVVTYTEPSGKARRCIIRMPFN